MLVRIGLILVSLIAASDWSFAQERELFFGLLHAHTKFSDGLGTPAEAYDAARDAGLDFFAVTEHNHDQAAGSDNIFLTPALYQQLRETAGEKTEDGAFVAIWGQEISTISKGNHQNVFFAPEICNMPNGNFKHLYETWLPDHPDATILQLNHPRGEPKAKNLDYGIDDYDGDFHALLNAADRYIALIEVVKGSAHSSDASSSHRDASYENEYFYYLNKGFHVAPSAGGDNHKKTWGRSMHGRMGVWATELTRDGLEEAILGRHCYASEDDSIRVQFTVNDEIMGSAVPLDGSQAVNLKVTFEDPDEPDARHRVQVYFDDAVEGDKAKEVENELFDSGVTEATFTRTAAPGGYFFAKVVQISDHPDDVWTAPVWVTSPDGVLIAGGGGTPGNTDDPPKEEIEWNEALDYIDEMVTVSGKVIRSHNHENEILFFNFAPNFRDTLSLVVFEEDFGKFDGADELASRLVGKRVTVHGKITLYQQTRMQIVLRDRDQIIAVEDE